MSAKDPLYGVVATVVPNCNGVDGGTYTGYIVQKSHFGGTVIGHSIKDVVFAPGDVVRIVQCGECLTYGGTDVPLHGWGFLPYAENYPSVIQVPEYSLVRSIETNLKYEATASMNWLCRKAGCIDKLYWPARITGIIGSLVTVCDQFGDGAYQMPISSDLSIGDFSIGDYVLVYSPSSGEEVIGWWMMAPVGYTRWVFDAYLLVTSGDWQPPYTLSLYMNTYYSASIRNNTMGLDFSNTNPPQVSWNIPSFNFTQNITINKPTLGWNDNLWPVYVTATDSDGEIVTSQLYNKTDGILA